MSRLLKRQTVIWQGQGFVLVNAYSPLVPRFELWSNDAGSLAALHEGQCWLRVRRTPRLQMWNCFASPRARLGFAYRPARPRSAAGDSAQARALHFNKGCYLGQEIVERIRSRGNVHRTFERFALNGALPAPGTPLLAEGKPVGELTSIAAVTELSGNNWRLVLCGARRWTAACRSPMQAAAQNRTA